MSVRKSTNNKSYKAVESHKSKKRKTVSNNNNEEKEDKYPIDQVLGMNIFYQNEI